MSSYRTPFGPGDVIDSVLVAEHSVRITSGTGGWSGSLGHPNGAASLYSDARRRALVYASDGVGIEAWHRADGNDVTGSSVSRCVKYPATASIRWYDVVDEDVAEAPTLRGRGTFRSICRLFDSHRAMCNELYVTASCATTCSYVPLFFDSNDPGQSYERGTVVVDQPVVGSTYTWQWPLLGECTFEAKFRWMGPDGPASQVPAPIVAMAYNDSYSVPTGSVLSQVLIGYSAGRVGVGADALPGIVYSTASVGDGEWHHVALTREAYGAAGYAYRLYVDGVDDWAVATASGTKIGSAAAIYAGNQAPIQIGGLLNTDSGPEGAIPTGFNGCISDVRLWSYARMRSEITSSMNVRLSTQTASLLLDMRLDDGPEGTAHGHAVGSGALDRSSYKNHGTMRYFAAAGRAGVPIWAINDCPSLTWSLDPDLSTRGKFRVLDVPSLYYGGRIATGSLRLVDRAFASSSYVRVLVDDGRGGVFVSGTQDELAPAWPGNGTLRVGNVFYDEGIVVLKDPTLFDFGRDDACPGAHANSTLEVGFRGRSRVPTRTAVCRAPGGAFNCSNNPTYYVKDADTGRREIVPTDRTTYVTTVGVYDDEGEMVAVARLAQPIRKRERDRLCFKIRLDL